MIGAREAALLTLNDIFYNGTYSNLAVKEMLGKCRGMDKAEKSLFTNLVYGVVSRHYTLEYVISKYSDIKVKKLARYVKLILEMGIYQMIYLDKIPESAAVNESVKLAKRYCKKGSDRFINAVLRAFSKDGIDLTDCDLSVKHSFSYEMTEIFLSQFGTDFTESLMVALNSPPEMSLRTNTLKTDVKELTEKLKESGIEILKTDGELIYTKGFDVGNNQLYTEGYFTPQDKGAYTASSVLNPQKGETVIDMCSAPGGKTTHMAELMEDNGKILAFDIHPHKIKLIDAASKRLGINIITAEVGDATEYNNALKDSADKVLCDVPCSGWGIIRRKPDIKLSHTDLCDLYLIQHKILENGAEYVKHGGSLVYSTCTINKRENEDIISGFLSTHKEFEKSYEKTFYPHLDGCDGFFVCRLDRK